MASPKPVFLLVHGGWHSTAPYRPFLDALESRGYATVAPEMPSAGEETPEKPAEADIQLVAQTIRSLADRGNEVVVVAHSSGGIVAAEAASGYGLRSRKARGLTGGVRTIVFVTAQVRPPGKPNEWGHRQEEPLCYPEGDLLVLNTNLDIGARFYSDIPREEQQKWLPLLRKHPTACVRYELKSPAYDEVDLGFVYCEEDKCFNIEAQKAVVSKMKDLGLSFREASLPSGHFPTLSMPEALADEVLLMAR